MLLVLDMEFNPKWPVAKRTAWWLAVIHDMAKWTWMQYHPDTGWTQFECIVAANNAARNAARIAFEFTYGGD